MCPPPRIPSVPSCLEFSKTNPPLPFWQSQICQFGESSNIYNRSHGLSALPNANQTERTHASHPATQSHPRSSIFPSLPLAPLRLGVHPSFYKNKANQTHENRIAAPKTRSRPPKIARRRKIK